MHITHDKQLFFITYLLKRCLRKTYRICMQWTQRIPLSLTSPSQPGVLIWATDHRKWLQWVFSAPWFMVRGSSNSRCMKQWIHCIQRSRASGLTSLAQLRLRKAGERGPSCNFLFSSSLYKNENVSLCLWRPRTRTLSSLIYFGGQNCVSVSILCLSIVHSKPRQMGPIPL